MEARTGRGAASAVEIDRRLQVLDAPTAPADHVVVDVGAGVPDERPAAAVDSPDDAKLLEELERCVDGG